MSKSAKTSTPKPTGGKTAPAPVTINPFAKTPRSRPVYAFGQRAGGARTVVPMTGVHSINAIVLRDELAGDYRCVRCVTAGGTVDFEPDSFGVAELSGMEVARFLEGVEPLEPEATMTLDHERA